jgi:hypothetical protein
MNTSREGGRMKPAAEMNKRELAALFKSAELAAKEACAAARPTPMVVFQPRSEDWFSDRERDITRAVKVYPPVMDGVCGFASVVIRPGTSRAARYAVKMKGFSKAYYGGVDKSMSRLCGMTQSLERKEAAARAYAKVLQEAGVMAYCDSRMD